MNPSCPSSAAIEREAKERTVIERIRQGERTLDDYNFGSTEAR